MFFWNLVSKCVETRLTENRHLETHSREFFYPVYVLIYVCIEEASIYILIVNIKQLRLYYISSNLKIKKKRVYFDICFKMYL